MKPYLVKTPEIIKRFWPDYTWQIATDKKEIYLTFDDGPHPEITPWVLKTLEDFNARATFFCVGDNIKKFPEVYQEVLSKDHSVGNHTFNHLNGWKTSTETYLENIQKAEEVIRRVKTEDRRPKSDNNQNCSTNNQQPTTSNQQPTTKLFRPPYGKIKPSQTKALLMEGYQIIMWNVLSGDFDIELSNEKCLQNVVKNTRKGSVIVLHDHEKAFKKLQFVLPKVLKFYSENGFIFKAI
ncbi:MAG: polysaccharide deacetylase family protein [Bacteroidota bacterium]